MTRDLINVQYPVLDGTQSVAEVKVTKSDVTQANGISIKEAFANKNNTLLICVENTAAAPSQVTFKAGDMYPNAMLGDLTVDVDTSAVHAFQIQDISRFETRDGALNLDFASGFEGKIYAIAKPTALNV